MPDLERFPSFIFFTQPLALLQGKNQEKNMFESSAEIPSQSLAQLLTKLSTEVLFFSAAVFESLLWCFLKKISYYLNFQNASFSNTVPLIQRLEPELNLQENKKIQLKSYLPRWINNYRVLLLVYLGLYSLPWP